MVGTDINAGMLAVAAPPGVAASDWRDGSADDLPFPDEEFDVALCQLRLQFFADKPAPARELRRVLVPGGRLFVLHLAAPEDFLGQYVHSTPLGAAAAQLDEEGCVALQREVVAAWKPFTEDGTLILQVGTTTVSARR